MAKAVIAGYRVLKPACLQIRHGPILYPDADRLFSGQRQILAGLVRASAACALVCSDCVCLENVAKARYLDRAQGFAMKAARYMTKAITGKAAGRLFWRWPLA